MTALLNLHDVRKLWGAPKAARNILKAAEAAGYLVRPGVQTRPHFTAAGLQWGVNRYGPKWHAHKFAEVYSALFPDDSLIGQTMPSPVVKGALSLLKLTHAWETLRTNHEILRAAERAGLIEYRQRKSPAAPWITPKGKVWGCNYHGGPRFHSDKFPQLYAELFPNDPPLRKTVDDLSKSM